MASPLIAIPPATMRSRAAAGGNPKFAIPSPEMSIIRCPAGSGKRSKVAAAASSAGPIAVIPAELRRVARTAAAKASALPVSATRVQSTVTAILSGSDHSRTSASIPPEAADIASTRRGFSKARAMPSCCRRYDSAVTLAETSTASTRASVAACAGAALSSAAASIVAIRISGTAPTLLSGAFADYKRTVPRHEERAMRRTIAVGIGLGLGLAALPGAAAAKAPAHKGPPPCGALTFHSVPSGMTDGEQQAGMYRSRNATLAVRATVKGGEPVDYYVVAGGKRLG